MKDEDLTQKIIGCALTRSTMRSAVSAEIYQKLKKNLDRMDKIYRMNGGSNLRISCNAPSVAAVLSLDFLSQRNPPVRRPPYIVCSPEKSCQ